MKYHMPIDGGNIEYIFAPFHDSDHSHWLPVKVETTDRLEVVRDTLWDSTTFSWSKNSGTTSFILYIYTPFEPISHDQLIVCLNIPKSAKVELSILRKNIIGKNYSVAGKWSSPIPGQGVRQEIVCDIKSLISPFKINIGKKKFPGIAIRLTSGRTDLPILSISWFGLRNTKAYTLINEIKAARQPDWSPWILPLDSWGGIRFERGLLFDETALSSVRNKLKINAWQKHFAMLETRANEYLKRNPEESFGEYLPNHDARYIREAQHGHTAYHWEALVVAFVGLVNDDKVMIQHALRYLMCMLHTRYWTESAEHNIPSSTWSHLSFMEEMTTASVAILADWLSFALFPRTKMLINKALWEKGIAPVMRDLFWREHMHRMNQGAVFNRAIVLGGLMLESNWRLFSDSVVNNAYASMCNVLSNYIKSDGGVHEGVGYLSQTMTAVLWTTIAYCRARDKDWQSEVRTRYGNLGRYISVMSTQLPGMIIPEGDCRIEWVSGDVIPILASIFPESPFADILENCLVEGWVHKLTGTLAKSGGLVGMVYGPEEIKESRSVVPEYDFLQESGKVSLSFGGDNRPLTRLWISGSTHGATHSHRDVSQFLLEIDGDAVFIDRGMVEYWFAEAHFLSQSWLHNVLTPVAEDGSYLNQSLAADEGLIIVSDDHCNVSVPGNGIWSDYLEQYSRRFCINESTGYSVIDQFVFSITGDIAFHLHSPFEFQLHNQKAVLLKESYKLEIFFPWAESLECEELLMDQARRPIFHICATASLKKGNCLLTTIVNISKT